MQHHPVARINLGVLRLQAEMLVLVIARRQRGVRRRVMITRDLAHVPAMQIDRLKKSPHFLRLQLARIEIVIHRRRFPLLAVPVQPHVSLRPNFFRQTTKSRLIRSQDCIAITHHHIAFAVGHVRRFIKI